jgi:hypothetical protein
LTIDELGANLRKLLPDCQLTTNSVQIQHFKEQMSTLLRAVANSELNATKNSNLRRNPTIDFYLHAFPITQSFMRMVMTSSQKLLHNFWGNLRGKLIFADGKFGWTSIFRL